MFLLVKFMTHVTQIKFLLGNKTINQVKKSKVGSKREKTTDMTGNTKQMLPAKCVLALRGQPRLPKSTVSLRTHNSVRAEWWETDRASQSDHWPSGSMWRQFFLMLSSRKAWSLPTCAGRTWISLQLTSWKWRKNVGEQKYSYLSTCINHIIGSNAPMPRQRSPAPSTLWPCQSLQGWIPACCCSQAGLWGGDWTGILVEPTGDFGCGGR